MNPEYQVIQYRMEIYEDSFVNDPTEAFHASTPFLAVSVGDYMNTTGWGVQPRGAGDGMVTRVKAVEHIIWQVEGAGHVGHSLSVCVEADPKPDGIW